MRVMISGATGFVGSHTAVALLRAGHEVRCLVRDPAKLERVFAAHGRPAPEHVVGDIADAATVKQALTGCEAAVHAAAVVAMQASRAREVLETNALGVENVVGGAVDAGLTSVVYVSSVGAMFVPDGPRLTQDAPVVSGENPYARSKSDAERTVRALQERGAPIRSTYPAAVVGPLDPGLSEANHALRTFVRDVVLITSSGFQLIDVRDLAAMHVKLVERRDGPGRYIAAGPYLSWREVADTLDAATGGRVRRLPMPGSWVRLAGRLGDALKQVHDFDFPLTREGMVFATRWSGADGSRTLAELGVSLHPALETFADTLRWMHAAGLIDARPLGRLVDGASR